MIDIVHHQCQVLRHTFEYGLFLEIRASWLQPDSASLQVQSDGLLDASGFELVQSLIRHGPINADEVVGFANIFQFLS